MARLSRRDFLKTATGAALASHVSAWGGQRPPARPRPNVLLIMTDQQPLETVHAYGNPRIQTPNIDRIVGEGVRFSNFYIAGFPCSPSRASYWTGLYPHRHGVYVNDIPLSEEVPSLGQLARRAGYATAYIGKWHLSGHMYRGLPGRQPFDGRWKFRVIPDEERGFRTERVPNGTGEDIPVHGFMDKWVGGWQHYKQYLRQVGLGHLVVQYPGLGNHNDLPVTDERGHRYSRLPEEHHMAAFFATEAVRFLREERPKDRPFCMVLSFYGPHLPVAPPRPWDTMYDPRSLPLPDNFRDPLKNKPIAQRRNRRCYRLPTWSEDRFRDYIARYYGYVSYIDHQIGRVLDALEQEGVLQDTILVFCTDHGDMIAHHGMIYKLGCIYEELMHTPFGIRYDRGLPRGKVVDGLVSAVDVLPTLLDLMGIPIPDVDGRSLVPIIRGARPAREEVILEMFGAGILMIRQGSWKYGLHWQPRDLDELYNLEQDPGELYNLAQDPAYADTVRELRGCLEQWLRERKHPFADLILKRARERVAFYDVWPELTLIEQAGDDRIRVAWTWHVNDTLPRERYWTFIQFGNPRYGTDGDIAFRHTHWPDPPTTQWRKGDTYPMGPFEITVPKHCGTGAYQVRIGLWEPEKRIGPHLTRGTGNHLVVGTLHLVIREGKIQSLRFEPMQ